MKRDLDLVREILLKIEDFEPTGISKVQLVTPDDFSGTPAQNLYHVDMLLQAGYLEETGRRTLQAEIAIRGLTMSGHDLLNAIREKSVWEKTKTRLGDAGGWTLDLVLAVAKQELKRRLFGDIS